jgi:hypothetical protein
MIRIKPSLAATARSVFAQDRIRNTGRDDFRRPETRSRDGMPGIFSADPICLRPRRGEPETIAVSRRFFPNHCVDPTASGPVAPRLRLSPAVDHARRSGLAPISSMTCRQEILDRMYRIHRMVRIQSLPQHPVDPVHPVRKNSSRPNTSDVCDPAQGFGVYRGLA